MGKKVRKQEHSNLFLLHTHILKNKMLEMCAYQVSVSTPKCKKNVNIFFEIKQILVWFALQEFFNPLYFHK